MTKVAVIFDTNSCHVDRSEQAFFGQRDILREISTRATIFMPQIVIDELMQQNIEGTRESINKLKENPLLPALGFDTSILDKVIDHEHAKKLHIQEDLPYEVIDIEDTNKAYEKIRSWVIPGNAPFNKRNSDGKNNSDKGTKDALVACTVDEFLSINSYDKYYLACNDGRLKEYYKDNRQISCLPPRTILDELKREFFDSYTLDIIRKAIDNPKSILMDNWLNINLDIVGRFEHEEGIALVVLDVKSKEIIKSTEAPPLEAITHLITSGGFATTHDAVAEILDGLDYYAPEDLEGIKTVLTTNDQVYGIGTDEDVKTLALAIFTYFQGRLDEDEIKRFDTYYELREV